MDVLINIVSFIVAISILVAVHEFGHFWVARRMGVKVLRFSIGFGRPLLKWAGKDGTEYVIAALPLGGYVKMLGEHDDTPIKEEEKRFAFNNQHVAKRFAIASAGPVFNFLFAIVAYGLMFSVGVTGIKPVVGEIEKSTPVAIAGLKKGDEIISVNGKPTPIWDVVIQSVIPALIDNDDITMKVRGKDGYVRNIEISLPEESKGKEPGELFTALGLNPWRPAVKPVVGMVVENSPAARAGLQADDEILAIDGKKITDWLELVDYVSARPETTLELLVRRGDEERSISVHAAEVNLKGKKVGRIGIGPKSGGRYPDDMMVVYQYPFTTSSLKAVEQTWENTLFTFRMIGKILFGELSVKNLSGPINIAVYAGYSASAGLGRFLDFLAIVSISLGVLNLLPIPVLDGGHLLYYVIEMVKGRPLSEAAMEFGQRIGIVLLLMLMSIAFYNDIVRLVN